MLRGTLNKNYFSMAIPAACTHLPEDDQFLCAAGLRVMPNMPCTRLWRGSINRPYVSGLLIDPRVVALVGRAGAFGIISGKVFDDLTRQSDAAAWATLSHCGFSRRATGPKLRQG